MRPIVLVVLLGAGLTLAQEAFAEARGTVLEVALDGRLRELRGRTRTELVNVTAEPLAELWLWLPANRLASPPSGLDERNAHWIYPRAFAPGRLEVESLEVAGEAVEPGALEHPDLGRPGLGPGQRILARLPLADPVPPGRSIVVSVRWRTVVPSRYGRFGRARGMLTLAGCFYPQVANLGPGGFELSGPVADEPVRLALRTPVGMHVVANGLHEVVGRTGALTLDLASAPYVSLVVARRLEASSVSVSGVRVDYLSRRRRYRPPPPSSGRPSSPLPREGVGDPTDFDYEGRVLMAARGALEVLAELGHAPPVGTVVTLVETPLRLEMVTPVPGGALVSDRVYRVTPLEPFFRFHDLQIARAVAWAALAPAVRREPEADRWLALDLLATAAVDAYAERRHGGRRELRSLLRFGAFIPQIDQLMYSPLIAFRHLFLRPFRDEDPVRDEPWRLANDWPNGAVLHDRLVDLIGEPSARELLVGYPGRREPLRELVSEAAGEPMGWFFEQWLGPQPAVNYRVAGVESRASPDGGQVHRVVVERQGDDIREPVTVRLRCASGRSEDVRWDGRGRRGELELACPGRLASVELDPARRLVEDPALAGNDPRFDGVRPPRLRPPVFNGLLFSVSAAERALYALVDFSLRRQHDARHGLRLRAEYDPRGVGADLFYQAGLGPLLDLNRSTWVLQAGLSALRTVGAFGAATEAATALGASLVLHHDTRWYPYDPMRGWSLSLGAAGSGSLDDSGRWGWTVSGSGRVVGHLTPRVGHTLTGYAGGGIVAGEPLAQQLQSISGRFMLRGFEADETLGRARLYAGVEYRWTAVADLDVSLFQLAWLRSLFLVAFAAGGTVSRPEDLGGLFAPPRLFSEVGVGARVLLDLAGVLPYVVALDAALPLSPHDRLSCDAEGRCRARAPVGVYVSIQHTM